MASALFMVRVESIEDTACNLRLYIIHPDQEKFYATTSFALQVLWDSPNGTDIDLNALRETITNDEINDENFVRNNVDQFIETVQYIEKINYPREVDLGSMNESMQSAYWSNEEGLPQAVIHIAVTDHKWIDHLKPGMEWTTTAYSM